MRRNPNVENVSHRPVNGGWCAVASGYYGRLVNQHEAVYSMTVSTRSEAVDIADSWSRYIGCPLSDVSDDPQSEESVLSAFAQVPNIAVSPEAF